MRSFFTFQWTLNFFQVAFDPFTCELEEEPDSLSKGSLTLFWPRFVLLSVSSAVDMHTSNGTLTPNVRMGPCYRIGTVGHDTQLCLWDVTEDFIKVSDRFGEMSFENERSLCVNFRTIRRVSRLLKNQEHFFKAQATIVRHRNSTVVSPFPQPKDLQVCLETPNLSKCSVRSLR